MNNVISLVTVAAITLCGIYLLNRKQKKVKAIKLEPNPTMYKSFFLTEDGLRGESATNEVLLNLLTPIIDFINESEKNLDLCFYIISHVSLVNAIIKAKRRNVTVRIITDYDTGIVNNKYTKYFYKEGIPVYAKKVNSCQTIMHNKFLIRDNKTVLQASLNLTKNTSKGSYDNVMITDDPVLVKSFKEHFEELVYLFEKEYNNV